MISVLLTALILADIGLLVALFLMSRKQETHSGILADLTEERRLLTELRGSIRDELSVAQAKNREVMDKVSYIAAEAEQEVKNGGQSIANGMEEIFALLTQRFEKPLTELSKRQSSVEALIRKVEGEKIRLLKVVNRGEQLVKFFDEKTPYAEVLKEIETKKYDNCRELLSQGMAPDRIALELGISRSEIELISHLA
jgi:DNA-binding NarL/FixJ family response regulator